MQNPWQALQVLCGLGLWYEVQLVTSTVLVQAEGEEAEARSWDGAVVVTLAGAPPAAQKPGGAGMHARRSSSGSAGEPSSKRRQTSGASSPLSAPRCARGSPGCQLLHGVVSAACCGRQ